MPKRAIFTGIDIESKKQRVVRNYSGTKDYSIRNPVGREDVQRSLKRLQLDYDVHTQEIRPKVNDDQFRKRVKAAEDYADANGDLIRRYRDDTLCVGVPHWRAMSLLCDHCPIKHQCDKVVALRLMYGGVKQFKRALSNIKALKDKYDRKAKNGSQGFQLEVLDRDIRDLRVLYFAFWKMSDDTLGHRRGWTGRRILADRMRNLKERRQARDRIMVRYEGLPIPAPHEVVEVINSIDDPVTEKYATSISDGTLEARYREYEEFKKQNSHLHKWRKLKPGRLAIVRVCRDSIVEAYSEATTYEPNCTEIYAAASDLRSVLNVLQSESGEIYGREDMNYNEVRRLMDTLTKVEAEPK